ncbi:MAG TPA: pyridoxamine 5'-phosphate oxidase family protein [Burkholderiales bacterium]|nr:pyridoxamine 5'-phosphate oxidase family protein [Burkholderiales bacterium]
MTDLVSSEEALRAVLGQPARRALDKQIDRLDEHCRTLIARSPFVVVSSADAQGRPDASPKGDAPGFVRVLDERTLAIPDRPGNRRADTFRNVLANPRVGLLFLIPGRPETLRVNGTARITRDLSVREQMAAQGKVPALALVVSVEEAFVHCGKCMLRSRLWEPASWPPVADLPSHARCLLDQAKPAQTLEEVEASVRESYRSRLY